MSLEKVRLKSKGLSQSLVPLKKILSMYQSTTNTLIAQFVLRETEQGKIEIGGTYIYLGLVSREWEAYIPGAHE